jgi:glycosyltransferase involved in cell wall biosynthesis
MINGKKVVVVLPAYNAETTITKTVTEIPIPLVDDIILVDDYSSDQTLKVAKDLGIIEIFQHNTNSGYGANQKTCYDKALSIDADIIIMLHPDYQYSPALIPAMAHMVASGIYPMVIASRILGGSALNEGMPPYKYFANRALTAVQNILINQKLSEYHSGYRAFSREVLQSIDYHKNSNDFIFDNEIIAQVCMHGYSIGEISCPTKYFPEASSINFYRSVIYGLGCLRVSVQVLIARLTGYNPDFLRYRE